MKFFASLFRPAERRRAYAQLMTLDDHLLRDIGLHRGEIAKLTNPRGTRA